MVRAKQTDVEFYNEIHATRREARLWAQGIDRRQSERHSFACRQWIAEVDGDGTPHDHSFREVECCDLSTGGFSFMVRDLPEAEKLCIRLGAPENYVFLSASAVSCLPIDGDGGPAFLIGCRFTGRTPNAEDALTEAAEAA